MADTTYNGWQNYETWLVNVWIDNIQGEQEYWHEAAREVYGQITVSGHIFTRAEHAAFELAERMRDAFDEACEGQCTTPGVFSDLLNAALSSVNWDQLAKHLIGAVQEQCDAETSA